MTFARCDRSSRALRRAAGAAAVSGLLFTILLLLDRPDGAASRGALGAVLALVVTALVVVAVRVLAHPRAVAMPPQAERTGVLGTVTAVCGIVAGVVTRGVGHLAGGDGGPSTWPVVAAAVLSTLAVLTLLSSGLAATHLLGVRAAWLRPGAARDGVHPLGALPARPDLLDDLATLTARVLPGSPTARGMAWVNRGLDRWSWSPRRRVRRPAPPARLPAAPLRVRTGAGR